MSEKSVTTAREFVLLPQSLTREQMQKAHRSRGQHTNGPFDGERSLYDSIVRNFAIPVKSETEIRDQALEDVAKTIDTVEYREIAAAIRTLKSQEGK